MTAARRATTDRATAQVLSVALALEPDLDPDDSEASRFERCGDRPLALAIETIIGHGAEDEFGYDSNDACWSRVDRWLAARTDDGFWVVEEFTSSQEALVKLAELCWGPSR
jgi:hypothetical protein